MCVCVCVCVCLSVCVCIRHLEEHLLELVLGRLAVLFGEPQFRRQRRHEACPDLVEHREGSGAVLLVEDLVHIELGHGPRSDAGCCIVALAFAGILLSDAEEILVELDHEVYVLGREEDCPVLEHLPSHNRLERIKRRLLQHLVHLGEEILIHDIHFRAPRLAHLPEVRMVMVAHHCCTVGRCRARGELSEPRVPWPVRHQPLDRVPGRDSPVIIARLLFVVCDLGHFSFVGQDRISALVGLLLAVADQAEELRGDAHEGLTMTLHLRRVLEVVGSLREAVAGLREEKHLARRVVRVLGGVPFSLV